MTYAMEYSNVSAGINSKIIPTTENFFFLFLVNLNRIFVFCVIQMNFVPGQTTNVMQFEIQMNERTVIVIILMISVKYVNLITNSNPAATAIDVYLPMAVRNGPERVSPNVNKSVTRDSRHSHKKERKKRRNSTNDCWWHIISILYF